MGKFMKIHNLQYSNVALLTFMSERGEIYLTTRFCQLINLAKKPHARVRRTIVNNAPL